MSNSIELVEITAGLIVVVCIHVDVHDIKRRVACHLLRIKDHDVVDIDLVGIDTDLFQSRVERVVGQFGYSHFRLIELVPVGDGLVVDLDRTGVVGRLLFGGVLRLCAGVSTRVGYFLFVFTCNHYYGCQCTECNFPIQFHNGKILMGDL